MVDVEQIGDTTFLVRLTEELGDEIFWNGAEEIIRHVLLHGLKAAAAPDDDDVPF